MPSEIDSDIGIEVMAHRKGRHANRLRFATWMFGNVCNDVFQPLDQTRVPVGPLTNARADSHVRFTIPPVPRRSTCYALASFSPPLWFCFQDRCCRLPSADIATESLAPVEGLERLLTPLTGRM